MQQESQAEQAAAQGDPGAIVEEAAGELYISSIAAGDRNNRRGRLRLVRARRW
jgi:hypothetical protein